MTAKTPKPIKSRGKVEKVMKAHKANTLTPKQQKIAGAANPVDKITGDEFKVLKAKKKKKKII
jgi:hypothetical protein